MAKLGFERTQPDSKARKLNHHHESSTVLGTRYPETSVGMSQGSLWGRDTERKRQWRARAGAAGSDRVASGSEECYTGRGLELKSQRMMANLPRRRKGIPKSQDLEY